MCPQGTLVYFPRNRLTKPQPLPDGRGSVPFLVQSTPVTTPSRRSRKAVAPAVLPPVYSLTKNTGGKTAGATHGLRPFNPAPAGGPAEPRPSGSGWPAA